jgi:hypothetical protein
MAKLDLVYSDVLQGEFTLKPLNLLLTIQVNCPGCFIHGLPVAQRLYEKYSADELNVIGMATAFEDFELNTAENARKLLETGYIVGQTKKTFSAYGYETYFNKIGFPFLTDKLTPSDQFLNPVAIDSLIDGNADLANLPDLEKAHIKKQVADYYGRLDYVPYTFTVNQFAGTPTWVIFDGEYSILAHWFGHKPQEEIEWIIETIKKG